MKGCELKLAKYLNDCEDLPESHCICMRNEGVPDGNLELLRSFLESRSTDYLIATIDLFGPDGNYDDWCKGAPTIYSTAVSVYQERISKT